MLLSDFYTVRELQPSADSLSCVIVFNKNHHIFDGHFPGQPVVPGVCMIQIIKELLGQQLDRSLLLRNAGQVKFLQLITPDVSPEVNINWQETGQGYLVNAQLKNDSTILFKLIGVLEMV